MYYNEDYFDDDFYLEDFIDDEEYMDLDDAYLEGFVDCLEEFGVLNETSKATKAKLRAAGFGASTRDARGRGQILISGDHEWNRGYLSKARQKAYNNYTGKHLGNYYTKRIGVNKWLRRSSDSNSDYMKKSGANRLSSENFRYTSRRDGFTGPTSFNND